MNCETKISKSLSQDEEKKIHFQIESYCFELNNDKKIDEIYTLYSSKSGIPKSEFFLTNNGKNLCDLEKNISDCGISDGSILEFKIRGIGGGKVMTKWKLQKENNWII